MVYLPTKMDDLLSFIIVVFSYIFLKCKTFSSGCNSLPSPILKITHDIPTRLQSWWAQQRSWEFLPDLSWLYRDPSSTDFFPGIYCLRLGVIESLPPTRTRIILWHLAFVEDGTSPAAVVFFCQKKTPPKRPQWHEKSTTEILLMAEIWLTSWGW